MSKKKIIRIVALLLGLVILVGAIFLIVGVSFPPEYSEIEADFKALMSGSQKINNVIFGTGLPTYEYVTVPKTEIYKTGEFYTSSSGDQKEIVIYYQQTYDKEHTVYSLYPSYPLGTDKSYVYVSDKAMTATELALLFPEFDGSVLPEGKQFYTEMYKSKDGKRFGYLIPYAEKEAEFYYSSLDPVNYEYVHATSEFKTVDEIKAEAEKYYSQEFLDSIYPVYFDGVQSDGVLQYPRFQQSEKGLMQLKESEFKPMFTQNRVFLFETAKIIAWGSSANRVRIEIQSYSPSDPEKITTEEIQIVKQGDGRRQKWVLNTPSC